MNDPNAFQRLLKLCKEMPAGSRPGRFRIQVDAKSLTFKYPLQASCTATDSLPDFEGGYIETWIVRYSCAASTRHDIFKFMRMSKDATGRPGTYLQMQSLENTRWDRAFEREDELRR